MKLYEISEKLARVIDAYNDVTEDEQLESIAKLLGDVQVEYDEKVVGVSHHILNETASINAIKSEIKRLQDMSKRKAKAIEWFKNYLLNNMEYVGLKKVETPTLTVSVRENPPRVVVENEEIVPKIYKREKIELVIDKKAILEAYKTKQVGVSGTRIERGKRVQIS